MGERLREDVRKGEGMGEGGDGGRGRGWERDVI